MMQLSRLNAILTLSLCTILLIVFTFFETNVLSPLPRSGLKGSAISYHFNSSLTPSYYHDGGPSFMAKLNLLNRSGLAMSSYCGHWQNDYIDLHTKIRNASSTDSVKRFIIYQCLRGSAKCKGLGDELLGITSALLFGILTNRALIIQHENFTSAFDPVSVDWRYTQDIVLHPGKFVPYKALARLHKLKGFNNSDTLYVDLINAKVDQEKPFRTMLKVTKKYRNVVVRSNRGYTIKPVTSRMWWGVKLRAMGLNEDNVFGCLLQFLLRPKLELQNAVADIVKELQSPNAFTVCIHIRAITEGHGDDSVFDTVYSNNSVFERYKFIFDCADRISLYFAKSNQTVKWFFMSSFYHLKKLAAEAYPDKIVKLDVEPKHIDYVKESEDYVVILREIVTEWHLYASCDKFIFTSSGLSKTASMYSLQHHSTYMFPHYVFTSKLNPQKALRTFCNPSVPTPPSFMAREWSRL